MHMCPSLRCLLELGSGQAQRMACLALAKLLILKLERRAWHLPALLSSAQPSPGSCNIVASALSGRLNSLVWAAPE